MSRTHSVLIPFLVVLGLSFTGGLSFAGDDIVCRMPGGIGSADPAENRALKKLQDAGKEAVGREVTDASQARIYLTVWNGQLFAATNFKSVCPAQARASFREILDSDNRFTPTKLLTEDSSWTPQKIAREFLLGDFTNAGFRDDITFLLDEKFVSDRTFGRMNFGTAKRIKVIDANGDAWARDAYDLVSGNSDLKRWAKRVGATDVDSIKRVSDLIGDSDFITVAARFNPSSMSELASLKDTLKDGDLVRAVNRLRISTTRDLDGLRGVLARYRSPELRKASTADKTLTLNDGNGGATTKVSDLLTRLRSGDSLPAEWTAKGEKVLMLDVADLSAAETGKLAGKVLELVAEASPDGDGPVLVFTKNPTRARQRLTGFIDYREVEFRNDEASLLKVERFGPLAKDILDGLVAGESDGPHFRFVVGHLDGDASVLGRLISDAKAGKFRDSHLGVGVCNNPKNWEKFLELYDAAMENGALSVTFPTRAMNVPAMTLMAVTLKSNPSLLRLNAPQVAVRKAYREAYRILSTATNPIFNESDQVTAIRREFGEKALMLFMVDGKLHQPTIDEVLRALKTDGVRMVPLAKNSSPSKGVATASLFDDNQCDASRFIRLC